MKLNNVLGIFIISGIVILLSFVLIVDENLFFAEAYELDSSGCSWQKDILTWDSGANMTTNNSSNMREAASNYNQIPINMFFEETSTNPDITAFRYDIDSESRGFSSFGCFPNGTSTGPATLGVNENSHFLSSNQKRQATWSHELGHILGLDHPTSFTINFNATNMMPTAESYDNYGIFVPVLDDIRGLQSLYGEPNSTPQCTKHVSNGVILYTGSCDGENELLTTSELVTVAGAQNRAFASDTPSGILMPDSDTLLITTIVKPNVLYRFSTGIHTNTNVADTTSRYATIEVNNNGIFAVWTTLIGTVGSSTLSSATPSLSDEYFLEIVSQEGEDSTAYAYINDAVGSNPPTFLGSHKFTPGPTWSGIKYFGTGVWTDSPSDPLSNYSINKYHHYSTCLPNLNSNWVVNYDCVLPKSATAQNNVTIGNDSQFIVPANSTLNIDFLNNYLKIENGSSVIIRHTGMID